MQRKRTRSRRLIQIASDGRWRAALVDDADDVARLISLLHGGNSCALMFPAPPTSSMSVGSSPILLTRLDPGQMRRRSCQAAIN
jgi:hypothetical protein